MGAGGWDYPPFSFVKKAFVPLSHAVIIMPDVGCPCAAPQEEDILQLSWHYGPVD